MIEGKWYVQNSDISLPLTLREAVFARGRDALDACAQQVVVFREGTPVGTARLWWEDGEFWAGDIGVLPDERRQGYGDLLVRLLLYKATTHCARSLTIVCPSSLSAFFARYGFTAVQPPAPAKDIAGNGSLASAASAVLPENSGEVSQTLVMRASLDDAGQGCAGCGGCGQNKG